MTPSTLLLALASAALAPAQEPAAELRFAVLGHLRGDRTGALHFMLDEIVDEVARAEPDLLILTGDMVFGDIHQVVDRAAVTRDWEGLDQALARTGAEILRLPGNHDIHDPVTRDIWLERYGPPGQVVRRGNCLFVLLNTLPLPVDEGHEPEALTASGLPADQLELLRGALADPNSYDHAFVFLHYLLWWPREGAWWSDVHPLLVQGKVRAVYGGDMKDVFKFSHERRDGVDYVQSALSNAPMPTERLRAYEGVRLRQVQPDTLPLVTVRGDRVETQVLVLGALVDGRRTPDTYLAGYDRGEPPPPPSKLWSPWVLAPGALLALAIVFALGRRSARPRRGGASALT
jgi:hypothetical protein